jgi:hypothetical protein
MGRKGRIARGKPRAELNGTAFAGWSVRGNRTLAGPDPQLRPPPRAQHRGGLTVLLKRKTPESGSLSGAVFICLPGLLVWRFVGRLNLECPQHNRANKQKRGAHSEYIHSQGKVHGMPPLLELSS